MRVKFLAVVLCFIIFSSCGLQEKHEAKEFYNRISGISDSLDLLTMRWHNQLNSSIKIKNYTGLQPQRVALGEFISNTRQYVANVVPTSKNDTIKTNLEALLEAQANVVNDVYPTFELLSEFTPKTTLAKNIALLGEDSLKEKEGTERIRKQLVAYAKKYQLKK